MRKLTALTLAAIALPACGTASGPVDLDGASHQAQSEVTTLREAFDDLGVKLFCDVFAKGIERWDDEDYRKEQDASKEYVQEMHYLIDTHC